MIGKDWWRKQDCAKELQRSLALGPKGTGIWQWLLMQYRAKHPIPDDDEQLAQLVAVDLKTWKKYRTRVLADFVVRNGEIRHPGEDADIAKAEQIRQQKRRAATFRWHGEESSESDDEGSVIEPFKAAGGDR
jgi:uncharacterized protein YdaU (DUF1376 family)